mmetsp:Transcript_126836/g.406112  ORF Transcript_126836/g.406112 Transcript_126836/m.406112 type:complete len:270 (+) Transcript_126836:598-1407(+)
MAHLIPRACHQLGLRVDLAIPRTDVLRQILPPRPLPAHRLHVLAGVVGLDRNLAQLGLRVFHLTPQLLPDLLFACATFRGRRLLSPQKRIRRQLDRLRQELVGAVIGGLPETLGTATVVRHCAIVHRKALQAHRLTWATPGLRPAAWLPMERRLARRPHRCLNSRGSRLRHRCHGVWGRRCRNGRCGRGGRRHHGRRQGARGGRRCLRHKLLLLQQAAATPTCDSTRRPSGRKVDHEQGCKATSTKREQDFHPGVRWPKTATVFQGMAI